MKLRGTKKIEKIIFFSIFETKNSNKFPIKNMKIHD